MVRRSYVHKYRTNSCPDAAATELAKELDGLPLALAIAGAYLN
jgi:hypothetical protein